MHIRDYLRNSKVNHEVGELEGLSYGLAKGLCEDLTLYNDPKYGAKDLGGLYRKINFWCEKGLVDDHREGKKGWRKFSPRDIHWFILVETIRGWGYPVKDLLYAKEMLFGLTGSYADSFCQITDTKIGDCVNRCNHKKVSSPTYPNKPYPLFEIYLHKIFVGDIVFLIIRRDGFIELADIRELMTSPPIEGLCLNLTRQFNAKAYGGSPCLSEQEWALIKNIRSGKHKEIELRTSDKGEIKTIKKWTEIDPKENFNEILKACAYQNLVIEQRGGRVLAISQISSERIV